MTKGEYDMHAGTYFDAQSLDDLLTEVLVQLLGEPETISASEGKFTEIFGAMLVLRNPRSRLSRSESKGKIFSALGELFWYLSKANSYEFISYYIPCGYKKEVDDNDHSVRSGYGERLFGQDSINQVQNVTNLLKEDKRPTSRRAVIQLFDASDLLKDFKQVPCTCTLQFLLRSGKLNLLVNMRSNDAYKGLPHDIFAFTMLQELIARSIGADVGTYKHCAGSLHLYERDRDKAETYIREGWQSPTAMNPMPNGDPWSSVDIVRKIEERARNGEHVDLSSLDLDSYWKDICRLFLVFRELKRGKEQFAKSYPACKAIRDEMSSEVYRMFIDAKLDSFDTLDGDK